MARTKPELGMAAGIMLDTSVVNTIHAAAKGGWDSVGIWLEPDNWTAQTLREVKQALSDTGLTPLDAEVVWLQPGDQDPLHEKFIHMALELGARHILSVSSDEDPQRTADKLAALADIAAQGGTRLCMEYLPLTPYKTLDDALDVIKRAGHPNLGILPDTTHITRMKTPMAALKDVPPERIPYAQICDGVLDIGTMDYDALVEDAIDGRVCPGEGEMDVDGFMAALPPGIPLSAEIRSKKWRDAYPDVFERAAAMKQVMDSWFAGWVARG